MLLSCHVSLHVPGTVDVDRPAPEKQAEWTGRVATAFSRMFNGANMIQTQGYWISPKKGLVAEDVNIVTSYMSQAKLAANRVNVRSLALAMRADMGQEMVALEINGVLELLDGVHAEAV